MDENKFTYSYSAPTEDEKKMIESIRNEYLPQDETQGKMKKLLDINKRVKNLSQAFGISLGVVGLLIFGLGMCLALKTLTVAAWAMPVGIVVGVFGMVIMGITYPLYARLNKMLKEKHKQEILSLCDELMGD